MRQEDGSLTVDIGNVKGGVFDPARSQGEHQHQAGHKRAEGVVS